MAGNRLAESHSLSGSSRYYRRVSSHSTPAPSIRDVLLFFYRPAVAATAPLLLLPPPLWGPILFVIYRLFSFCRLSSTAAD